MEAWLERNKNCCIALPISSPTLYFGINLITGRRGLLTLINLKKEINYVRQQVHEF
ncbi:hypothetical protein [Wolbachia endosymbiont (group B) of Sphaerophoria taeniata]|uniref:hypothetical protein n=1 Tax=Wolbachia endosymbiont (group B) of Sphaerophoria taeniata TaxID=2954058 RepID=UPI0022208C98|nr:hypothetical protein [Wolbachia endosymbiont (group B) of Sphaerophoria taeniata]